MALTVTVTDEQVTGQQRKVSGTIDFDDSYLSGGESLTPAMLGLTTLDKIVVTPFLGFVFDHTAADNLLHAYWVDTTVDGAPLAEVPSMTNMDDIVPSFTAWGV